jgi:hypothetical protein
MSFFQNFFNLKPPEAEIKQEPEPEPEPEPGPEPEVENEDEFQEKYNVCTQASELYSDLMTESGQVKKSRNKLLVGLQLDKEFKNLCLNDTDLNGWKCLIDHKDTIDFVKDMDWEKNVLTIGDCGTLQGLGKEELKEITDSVRGSNETALLRKSMNNIRKETHLHIQKKHNNLHERIKKLEILEMQKTQNVAQKSVQKMNTQFCLHLNNQTPPVCVNAHQLQSIKENLSRQIKDGDMITLRSKKDGKRLQNSSPVATFQNKNRDLYEQLFVEKM